MTEQTSTGISLNPAGQNKKQGLKIAFYSALFVFLLFIFTLAKLPQTKITALIQGYIQMGLDPMGIYVTDQGREFSIIRGFQYKLEKPSFELSDQTRIDFDSLTASPSFLSLLKGMVGGNLILKQDQSQIIASGAARSDQIDAKIQLDQVNISKMGLLSFIAQIKGTGIISGILKIDGKLSDFSTLNGEIQLTLKNVRFEEQNLMGFQLDSMQINEGMIDIPIRQGKLEFKNVKIGKTGGSDDLNLVVSGDLTLNRNLNSSALNLKTQFGLSDRVKQKLSLLDSILASSKLKDGRYGYKITGTLGSPFPNPDVNP